jgi:D-3-phosphoglycerate dehydrogenase
VLSAPTADCQQTLHESFSCSCLPSVLLFHPIHNLYDSALATFFSNYHKMSQTRPTTNGHSARPKVLIPEKVSPDGLKMLQASLEVHERKGLSPEELEQIIGDYDALIVRSETKVTASLMKAGKKLRVVARAGVGVDNVDLEAATKLGVIVVNSPQGNINAAAEHTIALLMAVARNVGAACSSLKDGKWERSKLVGVEVKGKTLCIIGLGKGMFDASTS